MALMRCGMVDGVGNLRQLNMAQKLHSLLEHEAAWNQLKFTECSSYLAGGFLGIFGSMMCYDVFPSTDNSELVVMQLPSRLRNIQAKEWRMPRPAGERYVQALDPNQDLRIMAKENEWEVLYVTFRQILGVIQI